MPPKPPENKPHPEPPSKDAPKADHKKYAEEFLKLEEHKVKPAGYQDLNDEAKP